MVESGGQGQRTYGQWWGSTEEQVTVALDAVRQVSLAGLQSVGATAEDAAFLLDIALDKALQGDPIRALSPSPARGHPEGPFCWTSPWTRPFRVTPCGGW